MPLTQRKPAAQWDEWRSHPLKKLHGEHAGYSSYLISHWRAPLEHRLSARRPSGRALRTGGERRAAGGQAPEGILSVWSEGGDAMGQRFPSSILGGSLCRLGRSHPDLVRRDGGTIAYRSVLCVAFVEATPAVYRVPARLLRRGFGACPPPKDTHQRAGAGVRLSASPSLAGAQGLRAARCRRRSQGDSSLLRGREISLPCLVLSLGLHSFRRQRFGVAERLLRGGSFAEPLSTLPDGQASTRPVHIDERTALLFPVVDLGLSRFLHTVVQISRFDSIRSALFDSIPIPSCNIWVRAKCVNKTQVF